MNLASSIAPKAFLWFEEVELLLGQGKAERHRTASAVAVPDSIPLLS